MRIGVIADVHGNAVALRAVLARLAEERVERMVCLGDVVGYGAQPSECVALASDACAVVLAGNHERAVLEPLVLAWFNDAAAAALQWTRGQLSEDEVALIRGWPASAEYEGILLTHGAPSDPDRYLFDIHAAPAEFAAFELPIGLFAHTHSPLAFGLGSNADGAATVGRYVFSPESELDLSLCRRWLLNPGSVGQPRDRDSRASAMVLDTGAGTARLVRVEYDIARAQSAMMEAGLPAQLVSRLAFGV